MVALSTYPTDDKSTTTFRSPAAMSWVTTVENSDSNGYISRDSPILTTATPLACSVVRFIRALRIAGSALSRERRACGAASAVCPAAASADGPARGGRG
jgi:hypothetical protein